MITSPRLAAVTALVAAATTLGGCSQAATSTPAPVAALAVPAASAQAPARTGGAQVAMARPVMPRAARDNTARGAMAMVRYYHQVVDYGYRTGDTRLVLAGVDPLCKWCRVIAANIRLNTGRGIYTLTPVNTGRPVAAIRYDARHYLVHIWHDVIPPGSRARSKSGKVETIKADGHERATWALYYSGGRWHMVSLGGGWCTVADIDAGRHCKG